MSVLVKGMEIPNNCGCCPFRLEWCRERIYTVKRPQRCPLVEIPPHGDLIDKEVLYNKTAEWEAQALAMIEEINRTPLDEMDTMEMATWRKWSAILNERSAFKHDVYDAPVVIEAEGEEDD